MELREVVQNRRSIRSFLTQPVPQELIQELIADSLWAPSWGNTQPWEIIVVNGAPLEEFREKNREAVRSGQVPNPEIPMPMHWPDGHKARYQEVGRDMFTALSIARDDKEGRFQHYVKMCGLFDAPAFLLVTVDKNLSLDYALLDVGSFVQTFCLLAHDRGLGTCIMAAMIQYPDVLRDCISVADNQRIAVGVAVGWPDHGVPINVFKRKRKKASECVRWIE